jgi:hypothetical protein
MKPILLITSGLLIFGIANLPIGYYTLLRIAVTFSSVFIIYKEFDGNINTWTIMFGITAFLFNPVLPIYLNHKATWTIIDIAIAILFFVKAFIPLNQNNSKNEK